MDAEIWRDIADYEGLYQVSNLGRVRSLKFGRVLILKTRPNNSGYSQVWLYRDGRYEVHRVHRLVAETFIPNPDNKREVNHLNGDKTDNRVGNLEWCTSSENKRHAVATGLLKSGENRHDAKLTAEQVIYTRDNPDGLTGAELARLFGVDKNTISKIQLGKKYRNVGGQIRESKHLPVSDDVREQIRSEYRCGVRGHGAPALAKKFGVTSTTIRRIIHEK